MAYVGMIGWSVKRSVKEGVGFDSHGPFRLLVDASVVVGILDFDLKDAGTS